MLASKAVVEYRLILAHEETTTEIVDEVLSLCAAEGELLTY